jgi:hypothetical protein
MAKRNEINGISPKFVRSANLKYSISLISNPLQKIKEILKIRKNDIIFEKNYVKISFNIDELYSEDCRIHLKEITFFFISFPKISYRINKTYDFLELQPDIEEIAIQLEEDKPVMINSFQYSNKIEKIEDKIHIPLKKIDPLAVFHKLKTETDHPNGGNVPYSNFDLQEKLLESVFISLSIITNAHTLKKLKTQNLIEDLLRKHLFNKQDNGKKVSEIHHGVQIL